MDAIRRLAEIGTLNQSIALSGNFKKLEYFGEFCIFRFTFQLSHQHHHKAMWIALYISH